MSLHPSRADLAKRRREDMASELGPELAARNMDLSDFSVAGRFMLVGFLMKVHEAYRRRGALGHWTYSVPRHAAVIRWLRAELAELNAAQRLSETERAA